MQISSRFTIALHIFACIDVFQADRKVTSSFIAKSVNVNPVSIRRIMQQLVHAGLITSQPGTGGYTIARSPQRISLLDIFEALDCLSDNTLFHIQENPNLECPVGRNIQSVLDENMNQIQMAMEKEMSRISLAEILEETKERIDKER